MKPLTFLIPVTLVAAALAACGGGDTDEQPTSEPTQQRTATVERTQPAPSATATAEVVQAPPTEAPPAATATPRAGQPVGGAPTAPPPPAPTSTPVPPPPAAQPQFVTIAAVGSAFSPSNVSVNARSSVTVTFDNRDAQVAHDLIVYTPAGGIAGQTATLVGPAQASFTFTPSGAGNYFFKCSLHPTFMTGSIAVQP